MSTFNIDEDSHPSAFGSRSSTPVFNNKRKYSDISSSNNAEHNIGVTLNLNASTTTEDRLRYDANGVLLGYDSTSLYTKTYMTINNPTNEDIQLMKDFIKADKVEVFVYQHEIGVAKSVPHIQAFFYSSVGYRLQELKYHLGKRAHFKHMNGSMKNGVKYCSKPKTRDLRLSPEPLYWPNKDFVDKFCIEHDSHKLTKLELALKDTMDNKINKGSHQYIQYYKNIHAIANEIKTDERAKKFKSYFESEVILKPWQLELLEYIKHQNQRHILWIVDVDGNKGKTFMARYLTHMQDFYYVIGKTSAEHYARDFIRSGKKHFVFDITRAELSPDQKTVTSISYKSMEHLKNGIIATWKNDGFTAEIADPNEEVKIVVMANGLPELTKFSKDRYDIKLLDSDCIFQDFISE